MRAEEAFGLVLRQVRVGRGISQENLAARSDLDRTYVSLLERGRRQPSLLTILRISDALNVEADFLVKRTKEMMDEDRSNPDS